MANSCWNSVGYVLEDVESRKIGQELWSEVIVVDF